MQIRSSEGIVRRLPKINPKWRTPQDFPLGEAGYIYKRLCLGDLFLVELTLRGYHESFPGAGSPDLTNALEMKLVTAYREDEEDEDCRTYTVDKQAWTRHSFSTEKVGAEIASNGILAPFQAWCAEVLDMSQAELEQIKLEDFQSIINELERIGTPDEVKKIPAIAESYGLLRSE